MRRRDPLLRQIKQLEERHGEVWGGDVVVRAELREARDRGDVDRLVEALADLEVRPFAAQRLGELGDPSAVAPLLRLLDAHDWATRGTAAEALGRIGDPRATERLVEIARGDPDPFPRSRAVVALGLLGDASVAPALRPLLGDESERIRLLVVTSLAQLGDPVARKKMKRLRRIRFPLVSAREPMAPLPGWMRRTLYCVWLLGIIVPVGVFEGRTLLIVELAVALSLDEIWLRLREREAVRRGVYLHERGSRLGCGTRVLLLCVAAVFAVAAHFVYPGATGLGILFSILLLFFRLGVEGVDRGDEERREREAG
jgi:hypothetical protein